MINAGDAGNDPNAVSFDDALNPDDDDIDRDGTRNDIGAYGGPFEAYQSFPSKRQVFN